MKLPKSIIRAILVVLLLGGALVGVMWIHLDQEAKSRRRREEYNAFLRRISTENEERVQRLIFAPGNPGEVRLRQPGEKPIEKLEDLFKETSDPPAPSGR